VADLADLPTPETTATRLVQYSAVDAVQTEQAPEFPREPVVRL